MKPGSSKHKAGMCPDTPRGTGCYPSLSARQTQESFSPKINMKIAENSSNKYLKLTEKLRKTLENITKTRIGILID